MTYKTILSTLRGRRVSSECASPLRNGHRRAKVRKIFLCLPTFFKPCAFFHKSVWKSKMFLMYLEFQWLYTSHQWKRTAWTLTISFLTRTMSRPILPRIKWTDCVSRKFQILFTVCAQVMWISGPNVYFISTFRIWQWPNIQIISLCSQSAGESSHFEFFDSIVASNEPSPRRINRITSQSNYASLLNL